MAAILLACGSLTIVDDSDFETLSLYRWHRMGCRGRYAGASINGRGTYLHRLLMSAPTGVPVDHVNLDTLDNRRANLRLCTTSQNMANSRKKRGTSCFKGVSWDSRLGLWRAGIGHDGANRNLGRYRDEEAAARAYDAAAVVLFGEFARVNFARGTR